jgi:threonine dehydrogenase-like Zn-dependent dehydrogenase
MRALVLEDWWRLGVQEVPDPQPGPDEVLIEIVATGICGSDLHGYTGENGRRRAGQVMGHETVGRIVSVPAGAGDALTVGDVVTVNPVLWCGHCAACAAGAEQGCVNKSVIGVTPSIVAAFAEYLVAPLRNVVGLAPGVPVEYGALVEPLAVGYHAVRRGNVAAGDAILVIGGGPIGQAAALGARRAGAGAVGVSEPDERRRALLAEFGVATLDPLSEPDLAVAAGQLLGRPPEVVIDAVGTRKSLDSALSCARPGGTVVLVGMGDPLPVLPAYAISTAERTLVGSFCYSAAEFRDTAHWVSTTDAPLDRLIQSRVDLSGGSRAFEQLARGESDASKVLVFPQGV